MKRVLITGGSRGIGRACVERFCREGYRTAFIYCNSDESAAEVEKLTGAYAIKADISDPVSVKNAIGSAVLSLGGLDALINNAGISQIKLSRDITDEDWARMVGVNLSGAFYACREAQEIFVGQKSGRIVNIGSMWGKTGASCEVHYSAAKAGIRGLTQALSKELGPSGITVNCIEPGIIDTDMNREIDAGELDSLREATPLGRLGKPEDVAALALFLCSDDASFITGQIIGVDGGFAV